MGLVHLLGLSHDIVHHWLNTLHPLAMLGPWSQPVGFVGAVQPYRRHAIAITIRDDKKASGCAGSNTLKLMGITSLFTSRHDGQLQDLSGAIGQLQEALLLWQSPGYTMGRPSVQERGEPGHQSNCIHEGHMLTRGHTHASVCVCLWWWGGGGGGGALALNGR